MARVNFPNYLALLEADALIGDTALAISQDDADILLNGMQSGDHTFLMLGGPLYTEVIRVTKVGTILQIEREQCDSEPHDFRIDDCLVHYPGDCGEGPEEECHPTLVSPMETILIEGSCDTEYEIEINPDALPQDVEDFLCELDVGTLLAGDFLFAVTKAGNGECTFKRIDMDTLCERLSDCNDGGGGGGDCVCNVSFAIDLAGHLIVTFDDMTTSDLGLIIGQDGVQGLPGVDAAPCVPCDDGVDGVDGTDGDDGRSVTGASIDANGELILNFSTSPLVQNVGTVVGQDAVTQNLARYTGSPSTGSTSYVDAMIVSYVSGDAFFQFATPMVNSDYYVSVTNLDGTAGTLPITSRSTTGFAMLAPIPAGTVSILVHA